MIRRCGPQHVGQCLDRLPCWQRVCAHSWGPLTAWLYVMQQLGLHRVAGPGLIWTTNAANTCHPRMQDEGGHDVDLSSDPGSRMHAIRNAWRKSQWDAWRKRLRHDSTIGRAHDAVWQPR
eukprot:552500-Alexandrium_andersonii.AAC.1